MAERRRPRAVLGAALATVLLAASACGGSASGDDAAFAGQTLENPYRVDPAPLTSTDGRSFSLAADTDARLTLVFFGYTHCPDICQVVMATDRKSVV